MEADLEAFTNKYDEEMWAKQYELETLNKNLDLQNEQMWKAQVLGNKNSFHSNLISNFNLNSYPISI